MAENPERFSITLTTPGSEGLAFLREHEKTSKADTVNRALEVHARIVREEDKGKRLALVADDGTIEYVLMI